LPQRIRAYLEPEQSLPAPGQGAMAIEIGADRADLLAILAPLNHADTQAAVLAERAVSRTFGGSCQIPLAAFAEVDGGNMRLRAMVATPDGKRVAKAEVSGSTQDPEALGKQVVTALNAQDATAILAACNNDPA
jgi:hydroxymethylbilane synthase